MSLPGHKTPHYIPLIDICKLCSCLPRCILKISLYIYNLSWSGSLLCQPQNQPMVPQWKVRSHFKNNVTTSLHFLLLFRRLCISSSFALYKQNRDPSHSWLCLLRKENSYTVLAINYCHVFQLSSYVLRLKSLKVTNTSSHVFFS